MSHFSSMISLGTQFVKNLAHEQGGAMMISEALDVTIRETNFTSNRAGKIASVIWAGNGREKTDIVAQNSIFNDNTATQSTIKLDSVQMSLDNCTLKNNTAS